MKRLKLLLPLAFIAIACSDEAESPSMQITWSKLGLDGKTVNEMQLTGNTLWVATTTGLYEKDIGSGSDFSLIGFENKNVESIEVLDANEILVSIFDKSGTEPPSLHRSEDGGTNWSAITSNFGGEIAEPIFDLEADPVNKNIVFGAGYTVVAKSETQGVSWQPVYGDWGGFATGISVVEINPIGDKAIWAGGQGAIENSFLLRSRDQQEWDVWNDLVENPSVVKEITFSDVNENEIFVGFEGALLKTTDNGESWETLIESEQNRFYFGIGLRKGNPKRVYTAGWLKTPEPQPLTLFISDDGGNTWQDFTNTDEQFGGVLEMQVRTEDKQDIIFLGLDKGGVYQVNVTFNNG